MADHKMNCLSHEVTKLKGELSLQIDNVQTLKSQVYYYQLHLHEFKLLLLAFKNVYKYCNYCQLYLTMNGNMCMNTKYMHVSLNLQKLIKMISTNILQKYIYS